jgi:peptidoglycan/LPS O-acetylase OafA/YrhL
MMLSTENREKTEYFLRKRLIRLVPLYWMLTVFQYVLLVIKPSLSVMSVPKLQYLVKSLFFIPFVNEYGLDKPMLAVGWTVNYEVIFILLFFAALHISHKYRGVITSLIIAALVLTGILVDNSNFYFNYYTNAFLLEYVYGIILFYIIERGKLNEKIKQGSGWFYIITLISAAAFIWTYLDLTKDMAVTRAIRMGIPSLIFVTGIMLCFRNSPIPKAVRVFGDMSYSVYLIEYFTTAIYKILAGERGMAVKLIILIIVIALTAVSSYISYRLIESGFSKKLYKLMKIKG